MVLHVRDTHDTMKDSEEQGIESKENCTAKEIRSEKGKLRIGKKNICKPYI